MNGSPGSAARLALLGLALACGSAPAAFVIGLNYLDIGAGGVNGSGISPGQQALFEQAAALWQGHITGYQPGISLGGLSIDVSAPAIDGPFGITGAADVSSTVIEGGFVLGTVGYMQFDAADLAWMQSMGLLDEVIAHEMAHVIGFGTLWTANGICTDGSGQYTGAAALAAYRVEFGQPAAAFVPVEQAGGPGVADDHWNEADRGLAPTGLRDPQGRDLRNELMTGWVNSPTFVSQTTIQSFRDIGYTTVPFVPETTPAPALLALWLAGAACRRRRRPPPAGPHD